MVADIEKACAAAVTTAVEASQSARTATLGMLVALGFLILMGQWYLIQHWIKWSDKRDAKAERNDEIVGRFGESSQNIVRALHSPMAHVTFTFTPPAALETTQIQEAVVLKGGKC